MKKELPGGTAYRGTVGEVAGISTDGTGGGDKLTVYRRYFLKMSVMMFLATGLGDAKNR
jgi:hypothetical protein